MAIAWLLAISFHLWEEHEKEQLAWKGLDQYSKTRTVPSSPFSKEGR